jgi:hypothetical protein
MTYNKYDHDNAKESYDTNKLATLTLQTLNTDETRRHVRTITLNLQH